MPSLSASLRRQYPGSPIFAGDRPYSSAIARSDQVPECQAKRPGLPRHQPMAMQLSPTIEKRVPRTHPSLNQRCQRLVGRGAVVTPRRLSRRRSASNSRRWAARHFSKEIDIRLSARLLLGQIYSQEKPASSGRGKQPSVSIATMFPLMPIVPAAVCVSPHFSPTVTPAICSNTLTMAAPSCLFSPWARAIW